MIVAIFDTETTGLIKPSANNLEAQPYITELYVLKVEQTRTESGHKFEVLDEFESFFNVPIPISAEITKITGISDETLEGAPTFGVKFKEVAQFFTGVERFVAHNLAFDKSMLANECHRLGKVLNFPWPVDHICTVEKSKHIEQRRMSLTRLHEHFFNRGFPNAHRAKNDVEPLYRCYKEMVLQGMI